MVRKQVWVAKGAEAQGKAWEKRGPEGRSPASRPQICGAGARKGLGWNSVGGVPSRPGLPAVVGPGMGSWVNWASCPGLGELGSKCVWAGWPSAGSLPTSSPPSCLETQSRPPLFSLDSQARSDRIGTTLSPRPGRERGFWTPLNF